MGVDVCVICGAYVPEGIEVCPMCRLKILGGDLVTVVRCKDCVYYDADSESCYTWGGRRRGDSYCSQGARKVAQDV